MIRAKQTLTVAAAALFLAAGAALGQVETPRAAGARTAEGTVYWDEDGDGLRGADEGGVPGVRVDALDGSAVTDAEGRYRLVAEEPFICVSVGFPSGTWPTGPWFRRVEQDEQSGVDFGLRRDERGLPFAFVQITDVHGDWPAMRAARRECEGLPLAPAFYVCTGDMRSGDPAVSRPDELVRSFSEIGHYFETFGSPVFMVAGNHDTVEYGGRGRSGFTHEELYHPLFGNRCWERYVCPARWSFSFAGVHLVGVPFARIVGGEWDHFSPGTRAWIEQDVRSAPGERTVLLTHGSDPLRAVADLGLTLGLMGHHHTEGRVFPPGSEESTFPANVLVTGVAQSPRDSRGRPRRNQDGRPPGYRVVVVEEDRLDTFYKPLEEDHAIIVNEPRRFVTLRTADALVVRGQFWDPAGEVTRLEVGLDDTTQEVPFARRRMWGDFEISLDVGGAADGFHSLTVTAATDGATHTLTEPYLVLTGRADDFAAAHDAVLHGTASGMTGKARLVVNGEAIAEVGPAEDGAEVTATIPAAALERLNVVSLEPDAGTRAALSGVYLSQGERTFVDQHRVFAWGFGPDLNRGWGASDLCFDLTFPGDAVHWQMSTEAPVR